MHQLPITTADGRFVASFTTKGLARLTFPDTHEPPPGSPSSDPRVADWQKQTQIALQQALQGITPKELPPLDLSAGTPFQQSVWKVLAAIPPGQTLTYMEVARVINRPKAARAVGQACGANPIPVLIPCHRVLATRGRLGGFSGGLEWKAKLLQREGWQMINSGRMHSRKAAAMLLSAA